MKKILALILTILSAGAVLSVEANTTTANAALANAKAPQIRIQIGQGRGRHRVWRNRGYANRARTYVQTRYVRRGYATYRETYQVTAWPNGQTSSTLISRQRVG